MSVFSYFSTKRYYILGFFTNFVTTITQSTFLSPPTQTMVIDLDLNNLSGIGNISDTYSRLGNEYIFSHIKFEEEFSHSRQEVVRFDGVTFILFLKGESEVTVNFNNYTVTPGTLLILPPERVLEPMSYTTKNLEVFTLFLSSTFIKSINFDLTALGINHAINNNGIIQLSDRQVEHMRRYFELLHLNASNCSDNASEIEASCSQNIARNIIAAILYQLIIISRQYYGPETELPAKNRKGNYVKDFFKLLIEHHTHERSVAFYAGKLFISPKYLSLIVKEATGRSATDWIDGYVIMAAKNLLRFSGENIQQVAYRLNFSNQSAFGKYFKHLTGMSPTAFKEK